MKIIDCVQGTEEWMKCRVGRFTASDAQAIANNGKGLETLCFEKASEILTGVSARPVYTNEDIERGHELENIARSNYEIDNGVKVVEVGFVEMDEFVGCSPDGLVGDQGLIEIKCPSDITFTKYLYKREIPSEYLYQMQMQMWVTGRTWCDYVVFNKNHGRMIVTRVEPDAEIADKVVTGVYGGIIKLKEILKKIKEENL